MLLRQAAQGKEDGELFSRALMFAGARQQLTVIDTLMSFPPAAASLAQSCGVVIRLHDVAAIDCDDELLRVA